MTALVADASVVVKCVLQECGSLTARDLAGTADPLLAPALVVSEGSNAIWKAVHRRLLGCDEAWIALAALLAIPMRRLPLEALASSAMSIALQYDHPVYDCYYIAAAIQNDASLATADERLHDLAQRVGLGERTILVR